MAWQPSEEQAKVLDHLLIDLLDAYFQDPQVVRPLVEGSRPLLQPNGHPYLDLSLFAGQFIANSHAIVSYLAARLEKLSYWLPGVSLTIKQGDSLLYDEQGPINAIHAVLLPQASDQPQLRPEHQSGAMLFYMDPRQGLRSRVQPATAEQAAGRAGPDGLPSDYVLSWPVG